MRKKKKHLDKEAAWALQSGPKSFPCPTHEAMDNDDAANATDAAPDNDGDDSAPPAAGS